MVLIYGILARASALITHIAPPPDAPIAASHPTRRGWATRAVPAATVWQLPTRLKGDPTFQQCCKNDRDRSSMEERPNANGEMRVSRTADMVWVDWTRELGLLDAFSNPSERNSGSVTVKCSVCSWLMLALLRCPYSVALLHGISSNLHPLTTRLPSKKNKSYTIIFDCQKYRRASPFFVLSRFWRPKSIWTEPWFDEHKSDQIYPSCFFLRDLILSSKRRLKLLFSTLISDGRTWAWRQENCLIFAPLFSFNFYGIFLHSMLYTHVIRIL